MKIINICTHPIHGRCYIWACGDMNYRLGTVSTNYMKFDGFFLEEVIEKVEAKGFKILPWVEGISV